MADSSDNRAVTALFRAFGGAGKPDVVEASQLTSRRGMHVGEVCLFALLVPLTVLVAVGDWLCGWLGTTVGLVAALPVAFVALNALPFALFGKNDAGLWRRWLCLSVVWAGFHLKSGGVTGVVAWMWIGVLGLNAVAFLGLAAGKMRTPRGRLVLLVSLHALALGAGWLWGWWWAVAGGAMIAAVYCWSVLRPCCQWLGPVVCRTGGSDVRITIDDGPDPRDTPVLLDLLDRYETRAVFFMIGEKAAAHPDLVREVVRRGHEIGNHTMTHPQGSFWCAGPWRTGREIGNCQQVIETITGVKPRWFRAPVGHRNWFTHPVAAAQGLRVMAWSRRGYDAVERDAAVVLNRILPRLSPGDIVLLHEGTPIAADVLEGVLRRLKIVRG
jgi:peptidoglycan/xylan/chitin deacetylase (PgdA/CDA1 family)